MWILIRMYFRKTDGFIRRVHIVMLLSTESSSYQLHYTDSVDKKLFKYVNDFIKNDMNIKKAINQK